MTNGFRSIVNGPALLIPAVAALTLAGCADTRGGPIPYSAPNFGQPDAPAVASLGSGYRIAPMDTVNVKVFKMPDLSGDYEVDLTGQLSMPLIGNVSAADLTTAQLDDARYIPPAARGCRRPSVSAATAITPWSRE